MKKMRTAAIAFASAIALIGAGYAAWGTQITDITTLNSGQWAIEIENDNIGDSLVAGDVVYNFKNTSAGIIQTVQRGPLDWYGKYDAVDSSQISGARKVNGTNYVYTIAPKISGSTVNFDFYNMHPGTEAITRFEIRNKGTITARISDVKVTLNNGNTLSANQQEFADAVIVNGTFYTRRGLDYPVAIGNIPAGTTLAGLETALGFLEGIELKQQETISLVDSDELKANNLHFALPASALSGNRGMNASLPISIDFDFVQYNQN
ncbi:MAG: hypothetical protein ACM3UU_06210 [Ignavibacteriales bacterium]